MEQQEGGWPLGLQPLNVRVGLLRNLDFSGSLSLNTIITDDSPTSSSSVSSSSDVDTQNNLVGTRYSFVEDTGLFVTSDEEAAIDLTTLLKNLYNKHKSLQKSPLYIVAESYGGKFAATVGLSVVRAVKAGELKLKLGGVVLGDSWISPEDFVLSWGPLLLDVSRLDKNGVENLNSLAEKIRDELKKGLYRDAERMWAKLEDFIISNSNNVDFYNFLQDDDSSGSITTVGSYKESFKRRYSRYLSIKASTSSSSSCYIFTLN